MKDATDLHREFVDEVITSYYGTACVHLTAEVWDDIQELLDKARAARLAEFSPWPAPRGEMVHTYHWDRWGRRLMLPTPRDC